MPTTRWRAVLRWCPPTPATRARHPASAWTVQQLQADAPTGADGQPVLAQALSDAQLQRVAREVLQRCDAADAGWRAWTLGTAQQGAPNARHITLMAGALGHEFVTPPDPRLSTLNFNFETDPARMAAFHVVYDSADEVQLTGFRQRGGKLLMFHGAADPIVSALESVDCLRRLLQAHGAAATAGFARNFVVPGMTHCSGGPATDAFDGLSALVQWVEQGQAPERVLAQGSGPLPAGTRALRP